MPLLLLPDDLLISVIRHGKAHCLLRMESVCQTVRRLLRAKEANLWRSLAFTRFPALPSIVAELPKRVHDYRALYRMHHEMEQNAKRPSIEDYVLTVQLFSYDELLGVSSCNMCHLAHASDDCEARLEMPALWGAGKAPSYLAGQHSWSHEERSTWDYDRLRCRVIVTRATDLQPLQLFAAGQADGDINETWFARTRCPTHEQDPSQLSLHMYANLQDEQGIITINFELTESTDSCDTVLRYLVASAPWK